MDKATPRPWRTTEMVMSKKYWALLHGGNDGIPVVTYRGNVIAALWSATDKDGEDKANAALILKAVNSHDQLVEALGQCQKALGMLIDAATIENTSSATAWANCVAAEAKARAALKSAKGE